MTPLLWFLTFLIVAAVGAEIWAIFAERHKLATIADGLEKLEKVVKLNAGRLNQLGHLCVDLDETINGTDTPTGRHAHGATRAGSVTSWGIDEASEEQK